MKNNKYCKKCIDYLSDCNTPCDTFLNEILNMITALKTAPLIELNKKINDLYYFIIELKS